MPVNVLDTSPWALTEEDFQDSVTGPKYADLYASVQRGDQTEPRRTDHESHGRSRRRRRIRKEWTRFKRNNRVRVDVTRDALYGGLQPTGDLMRSFLQWQAREKKGKIGDKICVKTVFNDFEQLARDVEDITGVVYGKERRLAWKQWIYKVMTKQEGLTTKGREKGLADGVVVNDVLKYLWRHDEHEYGQARMRLQLAWCICVVRFMGLRPGDFLESEDWQGSNEGIWWGDCEICFSNVGGIMQFTATIAIRNRKNEKDKQGLPENFFEDPHNRWRCPVSLLLALAICDGALVGVHSAADLDRIRVAPHTACETLRIRPEASELPVIRRRLPCSARTNLSTGNQGISDTLIMRASTFARLTKVLGQRAGYADDFTPYTMRRGFANGIDKHLTVAERSRHLGHSSGVTMQYYLSLGAPCDVQSIMNGEEPNQLRVDFLRSMARKQDRSAPLPTQGCIGANRYRSIESQETGLTVAQEYAEARRKHFVGSQEFWEGFSEATPIGQALPRPGPSAVFSTYLRYYKERATVIENMFLRESCPLAQMVESLVELTNPSEWYYPNTKPTTVETGGVSKDRLLAQHLHANSEASAAEWSFCYICAEYFCKAEDWTAHCLHHLENLDPVCAQVVRNGITLRAGLCPFCLGANHASPAERYQQFTVRTVYLRHIDRHLGAIAQDDWPLECPHPLCSACCTDAVDFRAHLQSSAHGVGPGQKRRKGDVDGQSEDGLGLTEVQHLGDSLEETESPEPDAALKCKAPGCGKRFADLDLFFLHQQFHVDKHCPMERCNHSTRVLSDLRGHMCYKHERARFICPLESLDAPGQYCGKAWPSLKKLEEHTASHKRRLDLKCTQCGRQFMKKETLERHTLADHVGENPWVCEAQGCSMSYSVKTSLERHHLRCHTSSTSESDDGRSHALFTGFVE